MSFVAILGLLLLFGAACFGSWKAALYWDLRTREAQDEDPRDQEIRELGAALSIARKELARFEDDKDASSSQTMELTSKLEHTSSSLSDIKQKFNATKEHLNKEIEQRQDLDQELGVLRRELETAQTRVTELEVQAKVEDSGSGIIAGFDMLEKEAGSEAELRSEIDRLNSEIDRWKQHCAVLKTTNKGLRAQLNLAEDA